jgi:pullulanase/glycogen debranching enzyme
METKQKGHLMASLLLSVGVPTIIGDEMGRTQQCNHHASCHDNELSWTL